MIWLDFVVIINVLLFFLIIYLFGRWFFTLYDNHGKYIALILPFIIFNECQCNGDIDSKLDNTQLREYRTNRLAKEQTLKTLEELDLIDLDTVYTNKRWVQFSEQVGLFHKLKFYFEVETFRNGIDKITHANLTNKSKVITVVWDKEKLAYNLKRIKFHQVTENTMQFDFEVDYNYRLFFFWKNYSTYKVSREVEFRTE